MHVGFLGHDLHGLRFGPDGRLYFSIGDRGFNVTTLDGRKLAVPDTGSVLRCNPDGTELEVFATGLRNPQELAFDEFGNLFTGDNNSDSGDRARWVYLVEGGDSGWRIGYQFIEEPISRGPWNEEKLWYPAFAGQAAYIVPPIANIADGPSGLTYDPGVSLLPDAYKDHFFLVDFRGASGQSGIRTLRAQAQGGVVRAGRFPAVRLVGAGDRRRLRSRRSALLSATGSRAGTSRTRGGSIACSTRSRRDDPQVREVKTLLAEGMERQPERRAGPAAGSPGHAGPPGGSVRAGRARRRRRGGRSLGSPGPQEITLARIHAIWGLGQVARTARGGRRPSPWEALGPAARRCRPRGPRPGGQGAGRSTRAAGAFDRLIGLLGDASPRVRFFAAIALGKLGRSEAVGPLLAMLRANADRTPTCATPA